MDKDKAEQIFNVFDIASIPADVQRYGEMRNEVDGLIEGKPGMYSVGAVEIATVLRLADGNEKYGGMAVKENIVKWLDIPENKEKKLEVVYKLLTEVSEVESSKWKKVYTEEEQQALMERKAKLNAGEITVGDVPSGSDEDRYQIGDISDVLKSWAGNAIVEAINVEMTTDTVNKINNIYNRILAQDTYLDKIDFEKIYQKIESEKDKLMERIELMKFVEMIEERYADWGEETEEESY